MKVNKDLRTIYVIAIINIVLYVLVGGIVVHGDMNSYLEAWNTLKNGSIDRVRTPVYPFYLGIFKEIFNDSFKLPAAIGQYIVFLYSVCCFYNIANLFRFKGNTSFWTTLVYSVCPGIFTWGSWMATESLSMSGCIIFVYTMFKLRKRFTYSVFILHTLTLVSLLFLRPALIYILVVAGVFWMFYLCKKEMRKQAMAGTVSVFLASVAILSYMGIYQKQYGIFATTDVGLYNTFYTIRWHGLLHPEEIQNSSISKDIQKSINKRGIFITNFHPNEWDERQLPLWQENNYIFKTYPLKEIQSVIKHSISSHPFGYIASIVYRFDWASSMPLLKFRGKKIWNLKFSDYMCVWDIISEFFLNFITFALLYLLICVYTCILYCRTIHRCISWTSFLIYFIGVSNLIVAIVGAQNDWNRLVAPSLPFYLLIFADLCRYIKIVRPNVTTLKC